MNKSHDHARLLMEKAAEDQYAVERLMEDPKSPDAVVGFHVQQAVEKLLKAVLTGRAIPYGRTHDLERLLHLLRENGIPLPPGGEGLAVLTPYAAELRYDRLPPEGEDSRPLDRAWARDCVVRVRSWADSLIG